MQLVPVQLFWYWGCVIECLVNLGGARSNLTVICLLDVLMDRTSKASLKCLIYLRYIPSVMKNQRKISAKFIFKMYFFIFCHLEKWYNAQYIECNLFLWCKAQFYSSLQCHMILQKPFLFTDHIIINVKNCLILLWIHFFRILWFLTAFI